MHFNINPHAKGGGGGGGKADFKLCTVVGRFQTDGAASMGMKVLKSNLPTLSLLQTAFALSPCSLSCD